MTSAKRAAQDALFKAIAELADSSSKAAMKPPEKVEMLHELARAYRLTAGTPVARQETSQQDGQAGRGPAGSSGSSGSSASSKAPSDEQGTPASSEKAKTSSGSSSSSDRSSGSGTKAVPDSRKERKVTKGS